MERLLGKWRQVEHSARVNGLWCEITPAVTAEWEFGAEGIMTMSQGGIVHSVNHFVTHPDLSVVMVRPNSSKQAIPYSVSFRDDGGVTLTIHRQSQDQIVLIRS